MDALYTLLRRGFRHGVHPEEHKERTAGVPIQRMPFVGRYVLPLGQHLGAPSKPVVEVGERVERGQLIAEPGAFVSTSLHSPVTGWVRAIASRRHPGGLFARSIEIETDPYATQRLTPRPPLAWKAISITDFIAEIQKAGIVGMGGAAFPAHVKYSLPDGQHIDNVLVNGAECEPFLTNDHRLMVERPDALLRGIEILLHVLGAKAATIGVE
ncbi:MAG: electron transport complex subunit RsxC, partial [Chromatiaceae bacterium]|nr:electron transport complex subunit RsxC [Chromatiaceae bacterium]